jgi:isocitrate/isopropylmalate dehydrogenase
MSAKTPITVAHGDGIGPEIMQLMQKVVAAGHDIVKTETLRNFDGKPGFTLAQGQ